MSQDAAHPTGDPRGEVGSAWSRPRNGPDPTRGQDSWVSGGIVFAGVLMLCSGVLSILQGISAIAKDDVYARVGSYVYKINLTGWGWIHLIIGVLVAVTGAGVLKGMAWARFAGLFFVALSLITQFMFLPYAFFWPITMIAIDLFVIWALVSRQEGAG
ncbi:hypothetical protein [Streptomyces sp. NPDC001315]|uniref:DUF7144 family membrane protein n=1 Tax=Streptomyces sp. NPDC001315 TaxID=3364562 RepID=UPI0036B91F7C